jgi:hypothetical protein
MAPGRECVLLYAFGAGLGDLAGRIRALGYEALVENEPRAAAARLARHAEPPRAALLPADLALPQRGGELDHLLRAAGALGLRFVAVGARPGAEAEQRLRQKHVRLCLWTPFHERELRFVLNRALFDPMHGPLDPEKEEERHALRVPTELAARVRVGGREKPALVYSLSASGCFLETPRPSLVGGALEVVLPLPQGEFRAAGRVVLTNVPGNLQRSKLACGMGIEFRHLDPAARAAIDAFVRERARAYEL